MIELVFITANLCGFPAMRQRLVRAGLVVLKNHDPDVLALQEMWKWRYGWALRRVFPGWARNRPSFLRRGRRVFTSPVLAVKGSVFEVLQRIVRPLHHGLPATAVQPGVDDRQIVGEVVRHHATGVVMAFFSTHFLPDRLHRPDLWAAGREHLIAVVTEQVRLGRPVQIGCDANQAGHILGELIDGQRVQYGTSGTIDQLIFIDAGPYHWQLEPATVQALHDNSDHLARVIRARLVKE